MFRFVIAPVIAGIIAFLLVLFIAPMIVAETDVVASVANGMLDWSNRNFDTMPPVVASYIANLSLALVAVTAAAIVTGVVMFLVVIAETSIRIVKGIGSILKRFRKEEVVRDLPPIDLPARFRDSKPVKKILGRGFDSAD